MKRVGLLLVMSISLVLPTLAKNNGEWDWVDQSTRDWFKSLKNSKGFICCDISDGHGAIWKRDEDGFQVLLENKWHKVPDEVVMWHTPNKIGSAIVWYTRTLEIRCFLPESEV